MEFISQELYDQIFVLINVGRALGGRLSRFHCDCSVIDDFGLFLVEEIGREGDKLGGLGLD